MRLVLRWSFIIGFLNRFNCELYEDISALTDEEIRILTMLMDDKKILRMSYGVLLNNKIHVTRGPLVNMDDYIIKYDKHNRLATLNLNFLNQIWKVGVTLIE